MSGLKSSSGPRRIAITGMGLVTPLGLNSEATWQGLLAGVRAVQWLDPASLNDFPECLPEIQTGNRYFGARVPRTILNADRMTSFALAAAREAVEQARLRPDSLREAACVIGTSKIELRNFDRAKLAVPRTTEESSEEDVSFLFPSTPASVVAKTLGTQAGSLCPVAACATGLVSMIQGANLIRAGDCDVVIAGSTDSSLHPGLLASYRRLGVLAAPGEDPSLACRPFDIDRRGFAVGEGAGILVLEEWEHARSRQIPILAEWVDGILASDPSGLTRMEPSGEALVASVRNLLRRNQLAPDRIDCVSLHGTATPMNDSVENAALQALFASRKEPIPAFGLKGAIGHLMGAAGAVETAVCVQSLLTGTIPGTTNLQTPEFAGGRVNYCTSSLSERAPELLLKISLGFGGPVSAVILKKYIDAES